MDEDAPPNPAVKQRPRGDSKGMPGGRAALPAGSLSSPFFGPQADENRSPPAGAPSPVKPGPVVPEDIEGT